MIPIPPVTSTVMSQSHSHQVFRAAGGLTPFLDRDSAVFFWNQLRTRLRDEGTPCLALILMPNHGHLVVPEAESKKVSKIIHLCILAFKRKFSSFQYWDSIPPPQRIEPSPKHLWRQIRYVHLNPCRKNLVRDPLAWEFSTHRDYLGYTVDRIRVPSVQDLGFSSEIRFHAYVSSDPSTALTGTSLPAWSQGGRSIHEDSEFPLVSLDRVADLSLRLTRSEGSALSRSGPARALFYSLALAAGYRNKALISRYLKITQQSVSEFLARGRATPYSREMARQLLCDSRF